MIETASIAHKGYIYQLGEKVNVSKKFCFINLYL